MDVNQARKQSQQKSQWATCDPITLVQAAKQTVYGEIGQGSGTTPEQLGPLEEVISRFEHLTRASLGGGVTQFAGQGQSQ